MTTPYDPNMFAAAAFGSPYTTPTQPRAPSAAQSAMIAAPRGGRVLNMNTASAPQLPYAAPTPGAYAPEMFQNGGAGPAPQGQPTTLPGNNYTNPGLGEQAFNYSQNLLLNDPWQQQMKDQYSQTQAPSQGEQFMNSQLGSLSGPGQGDQYWNSQQGAFNSPFAGEQFARQATQQFSPTGQANTFNAQAQQQFGNFVGFQGPGNAQGALNQSQGELGGGTQAESNMGSIAGGYDQNGTYQGGNNSLGQYQQNASSGPMAAQSFYDQNANQLGTKGTYSDQNRSASQYEQTQGAFGDMPIAEFDPFYDRAVQLGTQNYNRDAAGRGVYGSSEALSGVGNVVTDLRAQQARDSFDAEMRRTQEQRARQELLGQQAQMGDQSSLAAFGANLQGLNTFGNLANQAGNQTLQQQNMLGNQARAADQTGLDAFNSNLAGAATYSNINNQMGQLQLDRNQLLGSLAGQADQSAQADQGLRISGMNSLAGAAQAADAADTNRYQATTSAMNAADRTGLDRLNSGMTNSLAVDANQRANFDSQNQAANQAARLGMDRTQLGANIANQGSANDLARVNSFNTAAQGAESSRQGRLGAGDNLAMGYTKAVEGAMTGAQEAAASGDQAAYDNYVQQTLIPQLEAAGRSKEEAEAIARDIGEAAGLVTYGSKRK